MKTEKIDHRMGFFEHIDELRSRLFKCLGVFLIGFLVCFFFLSEPVMDWIKAPLLQVLPAAKQELYFTHLFENFMTHLKVSGYCAVFLFSPFYFYQMWAFVSPGLHENEQKWVLPFSIVAAFFFISGALFAYYVLFPVGFKFFVEFGSATEVPLLTIANYYSTCLKLFLLFGIAFELPVIVCLLGALRLVRPKGLREHRRHVIIGIAVVSAMFAPPDAISMLLLMAPMILLYEGSIWVIAFLQKNDPEPEVASSQAVASGTASPGPDLGEGGEGHPSPHPGGGSYSAFQGASRPFDPGSLKDDLKD